LLHPYNGLFISFRNVNSLSLLVLDSMTLLIPDFDREFNEYVRRILIGHGGYYNSGGQSYFSIVIQSNPFPEPGALTSDQLRLPDGCAIGQKVPDTSAKILFRPQHCMGGNGERTGRVNAYLRPLFEPFSKLNPAQLIGGSPQAVTRHPDGSVSPNNMDVSDTVPSGKSFIAGSCAYWHPGSVGVAPHTCFYTLHVALGDQEAWAYYRKFYNAMRGTPRPRTCGEVLGSIIGLKCFQNMPEEVRAFLKAIGDRPQQH
jgi:hypothetical protein